MIVIQPFEDEHAPALAVLMEEMTQFYGASIPEGANIAEDLIGRARSIDIILAFSEEMLIGFATFATLFPVGGLQIFTYIQQVYVGSSARRLGVAQRLMSGIAQASQARGCQRLEWATSTDNIAARALYDGLGAIGSTKVQYVLEGEALSKLASL
jgi:ribosomal protein S18 acetylase RimI-like enzyme